MRCAVIMSGKGGAVFLDFFALNVVHCEPYGKIDSIGIFYVRIDGHCYLSCHTVYHLKTSEPMVYFRNLFDYP